MTGSQQLITVRFSVPVEGIDPSDGEVFLAARHRIAAVYARQDRNETLFIDDDGEIVARWATRLIDQIDWPDDGEGSSSADVKPSVGTLEWRKNVQEAIPARTSVGPQTRTPNSLSSSTPAARSPRWRSCTTDVVAASRPGSSGLA